MTTKQLLKQPTTLLGLMQVFIGLLLVYTGYPDIGGGLITSGFVFVLYQGKSKE